MSLQRAKPGRVGRPLACWDAMAAAVMPAEGMPAMVVMPAVAVVITADTVDQVRSPTRQHRYAATVWWETHV
jgi:hypothetical protein